MNNLIIHTNRYIGLLRLKQSGIPTPEFQTVYRVADLKNPFFGIPSPYGWTIRTCKKNGINEISLFYKNKISLEELYVIVLDRLTRFTDEFYIVYHSWDFYFSFNILKNKYDYWIEGKFGSQKNISAGKESPTFSIRIDGITGKQSFNGGLLKDDAKRKILQAIQVIERNHAFDNMQAYFEVAVTKKGELYFYEYWDIQSLTRP